MRAESAWILLASACMAGCATEEDVMFGDPARVTGGFGDRGGDGEPVPCSVNEACVVSWVRDVYGDILNAPLGGTISAGGCGTPGCHDDGAGGLLFPSGNPSEAYFRLTAYELIGTRPYVVPCAPELSHIMCNLLFQAGVDNPFVGPDKEFTGGCGSPMPKSTPTVSSAPLGQDQLDTIAEWIACGAPEN